MLSLTLDPGESITLTQHGEHIATIKWTHSKYGEPRLHFDAPRSVEIVRSNAIKSKPGICLTDLGKRK